MTYIAVVLTLAELSSLAAARGGVRVSLYLPTHRSGLGTKEAPIRLKNLLAAAEDLAASAGHRPADFRELIAPARRLEDDPLFWSHPGDGLALLLEAGGMRDYRLPARMEELAFVGERFCVRPLLPVVSAGRRFHVLALSQNQVRLIEATRESARELDLRDIPRSLEDAVGYDFEERSLQLHSASSPFARQARRPAIFHGQGSAGDRDREKEELERFLRQVDEGVRSIARDRKAPLVIAAAGNVASLYRQVSKHPSLVDGAVEGNPETASAESLRQAALPLVTPLLDSGRRAAVAAVAAASGGNRLVTAVGDALALLEEGRVALLLVRDSGPLWGRLAGGAAETHERRQPGDDDLLDLALHRALATRAEVHSASAGELPENAPLAALVRY